ncbi:MAG: NosD domain-containing protein, partial [Euryarchaeota archaeon]|nr:NosD domain-containing protein [Euryarchaeota archaeon]
MNTKHKVLLVGIGLLLFCAFVGTSSAKVITVDDSGGADFTKIQDAIDVANDGDTIYTYNGTYNGNLYIWKSLTLQGENSKETFVKLIQNDSSNVVVAGTEGVTISGFTMISNKSLFNPEKTHLSGIELYHVNKCNISNNIVSDFWGGIGGSRFSFCNFTGNDISNNSYGIYVWNCSYSNIAGNRVYLN